MNLNEVQAVYYLLYAIQFKETEKKDFSLVVSNKEKIFTADFLPLNESKRNILLKEFDYDFDIQENKIENCLATELFGIWRKEIESPYYSAEKAFSRPELILEKIVTFVLNNSVNSKFQEPVTKLIKNVHFLESGLQLDSMLVGNEAFEILSIQLDKNFKFIEY